MIQKQPDHFIVIQEMSAVNAEVGNMWMETGSFPKSATLAEVYNWAESFFGAKGRLIVRPDDGPTSAKGRMCLAAEPEQVKEKADGAMDKQFVAHRCVNGRIRPYVALVCSICHGVGEDDHLTTADLCKLIRERGDGQTQP